MSVHDAVHRGGRTQVPASRAGRVGVGLCAIALAGALGACSDDDGGDQEAFCAAATDTESFAATFDGLDPDDVDTARAMFRDAREAEAELRSAAPQAVRADIDILIGYLDDLIEGLGTATPEGQRPRIYEELQSRADQVEAASQRLELYVETNC